MTVKFYQIFSFQQQARLAKVLAKQTKSHSQLQLAREDLTKQAELPTAIH